MSAEPGTHVVAQNVANLYEGPASGSGLASQTLLGDPVRVAETQGDFCRVTTADRYESWIAAAALVPPRDDSDFLATTIATLFADVFSGPDAHSEMRTKLVVGTRAVIARRPEIGDWVPVSLPDDSVGYVHRVSLNLTHHLTQLTPEGLAAVLEHGLRRDDIVTALGRQAAETAKRLIGTPYLWGGCTPFGIDCSGLTQLSYKLNGIQLLRDAHLQFADRRFQRVEEEQPLATALLEDGDLVVFSRRDDKRPTHIGLALGDGRFIHARGGRGVRIDECDSPDYAATYLGAIRLSPDADFTIEAA